MSFVAKRKRVVKPEGKPEVDLGVYRLREWLQPECYAVAKELLDKVMGKWLSLSLDEQSAATRDVGFGNALVKLAWNIVNTEVRYRYDADLFSQSDFWMMPSEVWAMKIGDCEDSSMLLASTILRLFDVVGDFSYSWWQRLFAKDAPNCQVWIGFVKEGGFWYGHAWVAYCNPKYAFSKDWLILETTLESEVPMNLWIVWSKDIYLPVYLFNQFDSWRIDRDYGKLGLTKDYVDKHKNLIDAMINYVEAGVKTPQKWVHKTIRPVKPEFRKVANKRWVG